MHHHKKGMDGMAWIDVRTISAFSFLYMNSTKDGINLELKNKD